MIDIDFLIEAIKDGELVIHETSGKYFYAIAENFDKKDRKIKNWNILFLTHPENGKCNFQVGTKDDIIQDVNLSDYNRLISYSENIKNNTFKKARENQENILNYFRQKINDYDNGANKRL